MQKILLINPIEQNGTKKQTGVKKMAAKKRRTPAQIAATRRLVALNKSRSAPVKKAVKRKRNPVSVVKSVTRAPASVRKNPIRRRKNPIKIVNDVMSVLAGSVESSLWGAAGAVSSDAIFAALPLPATMKVGYQRHLAKGFISALIGVGASYVVDKKVSANIAAGGLTVSLYGALTDFVKTSFPNLKLGYYTASLPASKNAMMGAYVSRAPQSTTRGAGSALGAYVSGGRERGASNVRAVR